MPVLIFSYHLTFRNLFKEVYQVFTNCYVFKHYCPVYRKVFKKIASLCNDVNIGILGIIEGSVALGIYKTAAKVGISIPKDIAVVGYGNLNSGQLLTPALTTYNIPVQDMCNATVDLLVKLIDKKPVIVNVIPFGVK